MQPNVSPQRPLLSRREREVLELLARGTIDKESALLLGISLGTIRVYRKRIQAKLGVSGVVPCLLVAWRAGEVDLEAAADAILAEKPSASRRIVDEAQVERSQFVLVDKG